MYLDQVASAFNVIPKKLYHIFLIMLYYSVGIFIYIKKWLSEGSDVMAYPGSKGWYVNELKKIGILKHPIEQRKLELYKTFVVRKLYLENVNKIS